MKDLFSQIFEKAALNRASDIHIEPREEFVRIRFRVDGILLEQDPLHKNIQASFISTIKIMADLDIAENRLPQDGKCPIKHGKKSYDLRISTVPTIFGEKVVIRILERSNTLVTLLDLGFEEEDLELYKKAIAKQAGLILMTGPTGSGKTTTLYATLKEINSKEKNIVTIEDPVEYQLPGINQIQVNYKSNLTFPRVLRSVLRQDPDVILVGEIRDLETARIAVQAALTGHLVLSTMHTKDAESTATRLCELGIENYLVKDTLICAVAQRLVRVKPSGRKAVFEIMFGYKPQENMRRLKDNAQRLINRGITTKEEASRVLDLD